MTPAIPHGTTTERLRPILAALARDHGIDVRLRVAMDAAGRLHVWGDVPGGVIAALLYLARSRSPFVRGLSHTMLTPLPA